MIWRFLLALLVALAPAAAFGQAPGLPAAQAAPAGPPHSYVAILTGDSQACGTAEDQSAGGYVNPGTIYILDTTNQWVLYNPGVAGASGISFGTNVTGIGPELGFAKAWAAKYPTTRLYMIKECKAGSYQGIGPSTGTATINVTAPNTLAVTSGTVGPNTVLTGAGLTDSGGRTIYHAFSNLLSAINLSGGATISAATGVTATKYDGTLSWSSSAGMVYNGYAAGTNSGARFHWAAALATLPQPRVIVRFVSLGTNDKAATGTANQFQAAAIEAIARERADFGWVGVPYVYTRAMTGGAGATAVRAAIATINGLDPSVKFVDMDAQPLGADSTHWKQSALNYAGAQAFVLAGLSQ